MRRLVFAALCAILASLPVAVIARFTTASDDFNRTDNSTLGTNWIDVTSQWGISSNQAYQTNNATNSTSPAWWNPSTNSFGADQFSQVTCAIFNASAECWLSLRMTGTTISNTTGYICVMKSTGAWSLDRIDAGLAFTVLSSGSGTATNGDVMYCQIVSSTITFKQNGSTLSTVTDGTYVSGQPGIGTFNTFGAAPSRWDDWSGGDVGGGGSSFPNGILNNPILSCCRGPGR